MRWVLRSDRPLNKSIKDKISLMCDVDEEGVVNCVDAPSIYDVPRILFDEGLDATWCASWGCVPRRRLGRVG